MKNLKLILKSLINNAACVEGGRHRPWFFAVIIALLSLAVAIIPTFVQTFTKSGDQVVSTADYGVQTASQRFIEDINDHNIKLTIEAGDSSNILDNSAAIIKFKELADAGVKNEFHNSAFTKDVNGNVCWSHTNTDGVIDFQAYLLTEEQYADTNVITSISSYKVIEEEKEVTKKRVGSFLVLSPKYAALYVQKNVSGTLTDIGSIYGDYSHFDTKTSSVSINDFNGGRTTAKLIEEFPITEDKIADSGVRYAEYRSSTWDNWKLFYKTFYQNTRLTTTWQTTLLIAGIDAALILFMGLMIFILTRGKNNPFRIYTFWESQKIAYWTCITPAILTCGLSFLITSFSQIFFALFLGVRVMWLSMKTLRPDSVAPSQSNYSKPVKTVDTKPAK